MHRLLDRRFGRPGLIVGPGVKTGMRILYESPRDVGADRIANAVAAVHRYGAPVVVLDFGTATTFDVVNAAGDYLGGVIAPGVGVAAEALFRRAARLALERFGYTVVPAEDGERALELLRESEPRVDLVVADVVMPRMGGPELRRTLREEGRDVPFLLMSGYAERDFKGVGESSSDMPFLNKPWTIEELVRKVRRVLDRGTPESEASRGR